MKKTLLLAFLCGVAACSNESNDPNARELVPDPEAAAKDEYLNPAQKAYSEANDRMHVGMGRIDPDADIAFVEGMIPHHQGAIDMAKIVLEHGSDPANKKLANEIIAAQEKEIAQMKAWLEAKGKPYKPVDPASADHSKMGH